MSGDARVKVLEALAVLTIIASAAAIAVPKFGDLERRDVASQVLADVEVMRGAVYAFYSDSAYFPEESSTGSIPENLVAYLPSGFSGRRSYGTIQYKNWPMGVVTDTSAQVNTSAAPEAIAASNVIGATVITRDPRVGATAAAIAPATPRFVVGDKLTFILFGS